MCEWEMKWDGGESYKKDKKQNVCHQDNEDENEGKMNE